MVAGAHPTFGIMLGAQEWLTEGVQMSGVPPQDLDDEELMTELRSLHDTRHDTLRHGSDDALSTHTRRTAELEAEYLRRWPQREVDPERTREGARARDDG